MLEIVFIAVPTEVFAGVERVLTLVGLVLPLLFSRIIFCFSYSEICPLERSPTFSVRKRFTTGSYRVAALDVEVTNQLVLR